MVWEDLNGGWQKLSTLWFMIHGIGGAHVLRLSLAQQVWRYAANIIWQLFVKRGNLGLRKSFSISQCLFDQSLNKYVKPFNRIGYSWEAASCGSSSVNKTIQFSMLINGLQNRRSKWCETSYLIMGDWSGNGLSMSCKKLRILLTRMLTRYGVSKVLLLSVVIWRYI